MRFACTLSAGVLLCLTPALSAQKKVSLEGENALADFAQCAVRAAPRQTSAVISTVPGSTAESAQIEALLKGQSQCLALRPSLLDDELAAQVSLGQITPVQAASQAGNRLRRMKFSSQALRGAIATRLYLNSAKARSLVAVPGLTDAGDALLPAGYRVVRCAATRDPVSADRLVRSKRLSTAEAEAGRAFAPALNGCARGMGKLDISGTAIHGWAAEALYKMGRPDATEGR